MVDVFSQPIDPVSVLSASTGAPLAAHGPYGLWTLLGVMMLMFGAAWLLAAAGPLMAADGPPVQYIVEYNQPFQISGRPVRVKI